MAKKNKASAKSDFSPKSYLKKGQVRKLPVHECLVPEKWNELGKFPVIFSRKHINGNITYVNMLVDLYCTGVKDTLFGVNMPYIKYLELVAAYDDTDLTLIKTDYNLLHNIVFEAVAYAENYGIRPHEDFKYAELILEKDDDHIPTQEIPVGYQGKPLLILYQDDPRNSYYLRMLEKNADPDE